MRKKRYIEKSMIAKTDHHDHGKAWFLPDPDRPGCSTGCWRTGDEIVCAADLDTSPPGIRNIGRREFIEREFDIVADLPKLKGPANDVGESQG